jgi:hypothetical protein
MEQSEYSARSMMLQRRTFLMMIAAVPLSGCSTTKATVYHDPECGCCSNWTALLAKDGRYSLVMMPTVDRSAIHRSIGLPPALVSCHTALINGYAFEGHVPLNDVARILLDRPADVSGIAVPGMPLGSPGMESDKKREQFAVIAFGKNGNYEYRRY